jgi:hypothetical protein
MRAKAVQSRQTGEKGLKSSAIGFMEALIIGVASTAPAYSLATVLGLVVVMGLGFLLLGAILMLLWRAMGNERFFGRHPETVPPDVAPGRVRVAETAGSPLERR